jgi:2'-5' RNA ligase
LRLFLSVAPSAEAIEDLAMLARRLRSVTRTVRPELWHVTLVFLGEVDEETVPVIERSVAEVAQSGPAGRLRIGGGGRFGASVLWAGIRGDTELLHELAEALRIALRAAGVGFDERPYRPHLTIARPPAGTTMAHLRADVELLGRYRGPYWALDQVHLARSQFPAVASHEHLRSWPLAAPPPPTARHDR